MGTQRIFIVDDDRDFAESIAEVLEDRGYSVELAFSGEEAAGDTTTFAIEDDGRGFPADGGGAQGMGLDIMRYRAGMIDGSLDIRRRRGGGTVVLCSFPAPPTEEGKSKAYVGEP